MDEFSSRYATFDLRIICSPCIDWNLLSYEALNVSNLAPNILTVSFNWVIKSIMSLFCWHTQLNSSYDTPLSGSFMANLSLTSSWCTDDLLSLKTGELTTFSPDNR